MTRWPLFAPSIILVLAATLGLPDRAWAQTFDAPLLAACQPPALPENAAAPPLWKALLPTLIVGIDHRPTQHQGFDSSHRQFGESPADDADLASHGDQMTRWTIALRWQTGDPRPEQLPQPTLDWLRDCENLAALQGYRPTDLDDALTLQMRRHQLRALIDFRRRHRRGPQEVRR